jgi:hypothetical protein
MRPPQSFNSRGQEISPSSPLATDVQEHAEGSRRGRRGDKALPRITASDKKPGPRYVVRGSHDHERLPAAALGERAERTRLATRVVRVGTQADDLEARDAATKAVCFRPFWIVAIRDHQSWCRVCMNELKRFGEALALSSDEYHHRVRSRRRVGLWPLTITARSQHLYLRTRPRARRTSPSACSWRVGRADPPSASAVADGGELLCQAAAEGRHESEEA